MHLVRAALYTILCSCTIAIVNNSVIIARVVVYNLVGAASHERSWARPLPMPFMRRCRRQRRRRRPLASSALATIASPIYPGTEETLCSARHNLVYIKILCASQSPGSALRPGTMPVWCASTSTLCLSLSSTHQNRDNLDQHLQPYFDAFFE